MDEENPNEKDAISAGILLLRQQFNGNSDFDKGMRLLQEKMKVKKYRKFIGRHHKIPAGSIVEIIKFFPKRRALILFDNEQILTFSTLLRRTNE